MAIVELEIDGVLVVEKRLSPRERAEIEAVERLRAEAALLERLSGVFTPRLVSRGEDGRGPYHRTERVGFPTLAQRLAARGAPLEPAWIERAAVAALEALAWLHEASDDAGALAVVHADLSPGNLAVDDAAGRAVLLDFDLAWWREGPPRDGAFRGTVAYTAPEVARGEPPTATSDLFSLAATFLHAMTGAPPRTGAHLAALLAKAAEEPLLRAEHDALGARGAAHRAVLACLAHEPSRRPRSARDALGAIATARTSTAMAPGRTLR